MIMTEEKVLYTDGHDVTVTDSKLQVRNHEYRLNGVTKCGMMVLQPQRAPGIILLVLGLGLVISGLLQLIEPTMVPDMEIGGKMFTANTVALWVGGAIALIGIFVLGLVRERYSVRIATAEGEKDALISDRREYIDQVVSAINQAVNFVTPSIDSGRYTIRNA